VNQFELDNETALCKYTENNANRIKMQDEVEMTPEPNRNMEEKNRALVRKAYIQVKADLDEIANLIPNLPVDMEATESCDSIAVLSEDMITLLCDPFTVDMIQGVTTLAKGEDEADLRERMAQVPWLFNPNAWLHEVMWDGKDE